MSGEVVFAGFGGQGILLAGRVLAQAAVTEEKNVTFFPSYGGEMRGGTANCTVIVSDKRIDSPVISRPEAAVVFNNPSLDKYEAAIAPEGLLLVNSSMVNRNTERDDLRAIYLPANDMAHELGDERVVNMIMLGGYARTCGAVSLDSLKQALLKFFGEKRASIIEMNERALDAGAGASS